jgi:hypothetical protein
VGAVSRRFSKRREPLPLVAIVLSLLGFAVPPQTLFR